jgi:hypothetical protein
MARIERSSIEAYAGIVIAIISVVFPMTWWIRGGLLLILVGIVIDLAWRSPWTEGFRSRYRIAIGLICLIILGVIAWRPLRKQYIEENAGASEGELRAKQPFWGHVGNTDRIMEIGDSGAWFVMIPGAAPSFMQPAYDSGFQIESSDDGLVVTTSVRDKNGNLIAEVANNHWRIYPSFSSDKNYTNDALEVLDNRGHVVLQLRILPDKVRVQGEWFDDTGRGVQVLKSLDPSHPGSFFISEDGKRGITSQQLITPIFVYPSKNHLGEFAH